MPIETDVDRANYFDARDWGEAVLYAPRDGSTPYQVAGIFDEAATDFHAAQWPGGHQISMQEAPRFASSKPTFTCRAMDLIKGGKSRDKLTINGTVWKVVEPKADGTGVVVLILEEFDEVDP